MKQIISAGLAISLILLSSGCTLVIPNGETSNPAAATPIQAGSTKPDWGCAAQDGQLPGEWAQPGYRLHPR